VFLQGVLRFHRVFGWLNRGGLWWIGGTNVVVNCMRFGR